MRRVRIWDRVAENMKPMELALKYMEIFFCGEDIDELSHLFAEDLTFRGPLYETNSAQDYINSLKSDPPRGFAYEIIGSFEDSSSARLVYRFTKPGVSTLMAQLFEVRDDKISKIVLVFDTGALT
ncbi:MAG: nuclear transport factor 2 family protein [Acidobacteriota bacterium]